MTIQQIKYFLKVYSTENLTAAANDLFVTRSALSKSIKDVENEYSVKLFDRTATGLTPTAAARSIHAKACELLKVSDEIDDLLSEMSSQSEDYVYVGITPLTGIHLLSILYKDFCDKNPGVNLIPIEGSKQRADTLMHSGQMDICFTTYSETIVDEKGGLRVDPNFCVCALLETELMFCSSSNHPLAEKTKICVEDLVNESFVFLKKPLQWEDEINFRFKKLGLVPKVYVRVTHPPVLREIVTSGKAPSIQMKGVLGTKRDYVEIPLDPPAKYKIAMIWNKHSENKPAAKAFIDYCISRYNKTEYKIT